MPEFNLFMAPQGYWWSVGVKSVMDLTLSIHNCAIMFHSACQNVPSLILLVQKALASPSIIHRMK